MHNRRDIGIVFDGSFDGFLNIIYGFYYDKIVPADIVTENFQPKLGVKYDFLYTDYDKALKVSNGIKKKISADAFNHLYSAFFNKDDERYMHLFNYIVAGFKTGWRIDSHSHWEFVLKTHKYSMNTLNEAHFFKEFIRFKNTKSNILYSRIEPENNILTFVADHFASRLIDEKWIIHDACRNLAIIYDASEWVLYEVPQDAVFETDSGEEDYQELWIAFFNAIAIEERISKKRQRNMLPIRYRKNIVEFKR